MESLGKHSSDLPLYSAASHIAVPLGWRIWVCEQGASWGGAQGGTGSDEAVCPPGNTAAEREEGSCSQHLPGGSYLFLAGFRTKVSLWDLSYV